MRKHAFLGFIVIGLTTALVLPVLFGRAATFDDREGGDPWRNVIYDFQTLITGSLAVFAAAATVWQMRLSDGEQGRRHIEAMFIGREADRRRLERAVNPQLNDLKEALKTLKLISLDSEKFSGPGDASWHLMSDIAQPYLETLKELDEIIRRPQFTDAETLFDGAMTRRLEVLAKSITQAMGNLSNHLEAEGDDPPSWYMQYDEDFHFDKVAILARLHAIPRDLEHLIAELERMNLVSWPLRAGAGITRDH